jgi:uncharacterized protein
MKFYVDQMLGKLCKWLRIFGFDTLFNNGIDLNAVKGSCVKEGRVFLTRSKKNLEKIQISNSFLIESEYFNEQIKQVFQRFQLSLPAEILTRCLDCNTSVIKINKEDVKDDVPERSYQRYSDFYKCPACNKIFWKGTHYENTMKKINRLGLISN